jgi:LmbE family N-acetylglucosaminyl deacetylase
VVVVAAHPDDEVLGVGGTMALLAAVGTRLRLIAVSDGEASHPDADPGAIRRTRTAESAAALAVLGVPDIEVVRLRFPDTGLAAREDDLAARLRELCAGFGVCLAPWEADAHADHEAAGRAARGAARGTGQDVLSYPIWMWHWAKPADPRVHWPRACQVQLPSEVAASKRSAIGAFTSQLTDRAAAGPVLPPGIVAHFTRPQEVLLR